MEFKSINPYNNQEAGQFISDTPAAIDSKLKLSDDAYKIWREVSIAERTVLMKKAADVLKSHKAEYAQTMTMEMGKPITEALSEIDKCIWVCNYYAENTAEFLKDEVIETDAQLSLVKHAPIGSVLAIMPWNFPFWQVFRFAAPTLMAGNVGVLKHAPNVFGCSKLIEQVFTEAGFPKGVFQNLIVHHDQTESIIASKVIKAVTLTGSEGAGAAVAQIAGKYLKKTLLELGGNNAFIVWNDADIDVAVKTGVTARMLNSGQSCIAAKRFILMEDIYDEFVHKFVDKVSQLKSGDPMNADTQVGPLARLDLANQLQNQVQKSIKQGAKLLYGGSQKDCYHAPTVLGDVTPGMSAFDEETFGPLAAMIKAKNIEEAFQLAELSKYGLGVTVFTKNEKRALEMSNSVSDGAYFINELVKSDPRLPFGGTKKSGYGRELAKDGMMEFVNRKTVYLK